MKKKSVATLDTTQLRRQAEAQWSARRQQTPASQITETEALRLVHELEVHQIELEMQNEELLRSRADLEAALEQYDDLYDFAPVGYFTLTETGIIQRVNLTGARLLDQERSKLIKRRLGLFVDFEHRLVFSAFLSQVFATRGGHITCEVLLAQTEERPAPIWAQFESVGSVGELACKVIVVDITARKIAENALRASEEKYRGLMESLDSAVATIDYDGKFLYMNDTTAEQLGGTAAQLTGMNMRELFPEPHASRQLENIHTVIRENRGRVFEELSMVQGQPRWYRTSIQPIHAENGQATHVLINSHDINDLKIVQQELQDLNRTLEIRVQQRTAEVQDLYDNAPAGYHSLDVDGKLLMINQTELNWLGYTREEVLGRPFTDFYAPSSLEVFQEQFPAFKKRGWVKDLEVELLSKDQRIIPVVINSTAIYDANGNFVMSRSTLLDDSERKAANETLRRTNLKLEHALRMKDEFLANMSHELRTPLNGILGSSEVLLDGYRGALNDAQRKFVSTIDVSGRHLLSLINDLLDITKIEAGKFELQPEIVNISDVCRSSLVFVRDQALKKNIALEFLPETAVTTLLADQRRLKQVLINLLNNAVKFTPANGQVILKVKARQEQKCLEFAISDTGIGISAADLQRLFTPFTQVDGSLARQYEGTGLGLALVKRLTEMHGGTVTVTSVVGQGSCFTVSLPWEPVPAAQQVLMNPETETSENSQGFISLGTTSPATQITILLAEDNATNKMVLADFLEGSGYQMLLANNGIEALNLAAAKRPDLIIMDIQMPGMNGLEAIRRLRADSRFTNIPIIALTALVMPGDCERCLAVGANAYISKPVRLKELSEIVKKLISSKCN